MLSALPHSARRGPRSRRGPGPLRGVRPGRGLVRRMTVLLTVVVMTLSVGTSLTGVAGAAEPPPATVGDTRPVVDFDDGSTGGIFAWGNDAAATPALSVGAAPVPGTEPGNQALTAAVEAVPAGGWSGFSRDIDPAVDWSAFDGFSFAFLGTGSGKNLRYELKSGGANAGSATLFETTVVDDQTGWRTVRIDFGALRLKGNPGSSLRFDPAQAHGFAVTLSDLGAGTWRFDEFSLYQRSAPLSDFEGQVPIGSAQQPVGWFTWGSPSDQVVSLGVNTLERNGNGQNKVLSGDYRIPSGGYGGFSYNLAQPQDWSGYGGIRFWWYASQPTKPASPTAGADIGIEIKDGGPDGEHSELWTTTFKDNWSEQGTRWKLVEIPFNQFTLRGDFQPGSGDTLDGVFTRTDAWGLAITLPPGTATAVPWAIDDVALYGTAAPRPAAAVTVDPAVALVDAGDAAGIAVGVTTTDGAPLPAPVTVRYTPGDGTAPEGSYQDFGGTLTFPAGTESGATQRITVQTVAATGADVARTIGIELTVTGATAPADEPLVVINARGLPYQDPARPIAQRVDDLMSRMSQAEKLGQMTQAERLGLNSPTQITELRLGSLLSGGGSVPAENTAAGWADMIDGFQRRALATPLQIPMIYGVDAVHGHNNVVGATITPHNIGLGATRDPQIVQQTSRLTATEVRATGVPWTFAPCVCVTRDERWGRSYESFSEDPALVTRFAGPAVTGLQGDTAADLRGPDAVLATAKHWAGDGGTSYDETQAGNGYPIDQGITKVSSMAEFRRLFVEPYQPTITAGVGSIMPSYSAVQVGDAPAVRMHENTALNTGLLKNTMKFSGFLVSDWEGINKLPGDDYADKVARSVNSGVDMAMAPYDFATFISSLRDKVAAGAVRQARVDDAVRRILTQKFRLGLFEKPFADRSQVGTVGSAAHRDIARSAAAKSQVLLKNTANTLPLKKTGAIYLAGSNADDLGNQLGGWSISWQGSSGATTQGTTIAQGIAQVAPDAALTVSADASAPIPAGAAGVVVVGEKPYAEGIGDVGNNGHSLNLSDADRASIDKVCASAASCTVLVVSGRPQLVTDQLDGIDALVASWLPGTEGAGVADVLFGDRPFGGRLPVSWPASAGQVPINVGDADYRPLYPYGWGMTTGSLRGQLLQLADASSGALRGALQAAAAPGLWNGDEPRQLSRVLTALRRSATLADGAQTPQAAAVRDGIADVLRNLAQRKVQATTGTPNQAVSTALAGADHELAGGRYLIAVAELTRAVQAAY